MSSVAIAATFGALFLYVGARIGTSILADEVKGWLPLFSRALVRRAVQRLAEDDRERWEEEWLAELAAKERRPLTAIAFALGVRRTADRLASELQADRDAETAGKDADPAVTAAAQIQAITDQYWEGLITSRERTQAIRALAGVTARQRRAALVQRFDDIRSHPLLETRSWYYDTRRSMRRRRRLRREL